MQLAVGLIPAFAVAGVFEGFVTPSNVLPQSLKVGLGVSMAAIFWLYLLLAGHGSAVPVRPALQPPIANGVAVDRP